MSADPFAGILDPFAYWDIATTYARYSAFFDLVIYCAIFMAVSRAVFVRRFTGPPGKVLSTAIGLALGISLTVAGQQFGFSLREAGPIAVFIALLLAGFLISQTLLHLNVSWKLVFPLTYALMYLFARAMSPALYNRIADKVPFLGLLSALVFLLCLWQLGVALWPKLHSAQSSDNNASFIAKLDRKDEEREVKVEKGLAKKAAPQAYSEARRLERNLEAVERELKKEHPDWRAAAQALSDIAHRSEDMIRTVDKIRILDRRLRNFDWRQLQQLSGYYAELSESDRVRLKEQILLERSKIVQEHAINQLAERCERAYGELRKVLDAGQKACYAQDRVGALQSITTARSLEAQQKQDLDRLRQAENRLLDLTKLKLKKE